MSNYLKHRDHNVISDFSGKKFKFSECRLTWDNKLVHKSEWEPKHPQLIIHPRGEDIAVRITRTQNTDQALADAPYNPVGGV